MKQKLLADIELDVHELKCLMKSFSDEPTQTLSELLKRSISQMQGRLDELLHEVDAVEVIPEPAVPETLVETPEIIVETIAEQAEESKESVEENEESVEMSNESVIVIEEPASTVLGECIKLSAGLRHSISLNDSFRFSRELFGGDLELMNRVIEQISMMSSYNTAVAFLSSKIKMDEEKEAVGDFLELLNKYFNQSAK